MKEIIETINGMNIGQQALALVITIAALFFITALGYMAGREFTEYTHRLAESESQRLSDAEALEVERAHEEMEAAERVKHGIII